MAVITDPFSTSHFLSLVVPLRGYSSSALPTHPTQYTAPTTSIVPHPSSSTTKLLSLNLQPATLSPGPSIINLNPLLTQPSINSHHPPLLIPHSSFPIPSSHSPQICGNSSGARQDRISMRGPLTTCTPLSLSASLGATQNLSLARRDRLVAYSYK